MVRNSIVLVLGLPPKAKTPLTLGVDFAEEKTDKSGRVRGADGKYKKKE